MQANKVLFYSFRRCWLLLIECELYLDMNYVFWLNRLFTKKRTFKRIKMCAHVDDFPS